jgi:hypothetical protein
MKSNKKVEVNQMTRLYIFFIPLLILANITLVQAQDSTSKSLPIHYKYGIGGGAGFATGYGLSFRYIPHNFGGQVNFAPFKNSTTERYSVGLTFIYMLIKSKTSNLFAYQANHFYTSTQTLYIFDPNNPTKQTTERQKEKYFNNGLGFGIEVIMAGRIGLNLMAGYAFYNNFSQLNITGETALYYKF